MAQTEIKATSREVRGKKTRFLRREGWLPANIYGQGESIAIQVQTMEVIPVLRHSTTNQLFALLVDGERVPQTAVVRHIERSPRSRELLHIDFMRVSMTETMTASVAIVFVGESPAIRDLDGVLVHSLTHVVVSALPGDIPQHIEVDISSLAEIDAAVHAADLVLPAGVELVTEAETMIAKVAAPKVGTDEEEGETTAVEEAPGEDGEKKTEE